MKHTTELSLCCGLGNVISETIEGIGTTYYEYANDLLVKVIDVNGLETKLSYNANDYFRMFFCRYIIERIHAMKMEEIKDIFEFVEDSLLNGDENVVNLIGIAIIERLTFEEDFDNFKSILIPYMGKLTKESFEECRFW